MPIDGDPYPAIELIYGLAKALMELRRLEAMPWRGAEACMECARALIQLSNGLQRRFMGRGEANELLATAARYLQELHSVLSPASFDLGLGIETNETNVEFAEQLKRISVVIARMFDDPTTTSPSRLRADHRWWV